MANHLVRSAGFSLFPELFHPPLLERAEFNGQSAFVIMSYLMYLFAVKSRFPGRALSLPIGIIVVCTFLFLTGTSRAQVVINELGASNDSSVENGGKFPDWIELYNNSVGT